MKPKEIFADAVTASETSLLVRDVAKLIRQNRKNIDWEEIQSNIMRVTGCENILYACENDNYISLWEIYWNFNDEDYSVNTVEVIGNIFDNAELLESEG